MPHKYAANKTSRVWCAPPEPKFPHPPYIAAQWCAGANAQKEAARQGEIAAADCIPPFLSATKGFSGWWRCHNSSRHPSMTSYIKMTLCYFYGQLNHFWGAQCEQRPVHSIDIHGRKIKYKRAEAEQKWRVNDGMAGGENERLHHVPHETQCRGRERRRAPSGQSATEICYYWWDIYRKRNNKMARPISRIL